MAAALELGYDDERFESVVSQNYHCVICFNVFKDPVMCRNNEHLFCRACITKHLVNSKTCPSCMEKLTVQTLREAPRFVTGCLAELKIRCEYFDRGCGFVELEKLQKHVKECDFAPVTCSNEGCKLEVNKRDLIHHETAVCEQRRVKCHDCGEMRQELNKVNDRLGKMEANYVQLKETLEQMNANLTVQNDKFERYETLEAILCSFEQILPTFNALVNVEDESEPEIQKEPESEESESEQCNWTVETRSSRDEESREEVLEGNARPGNEGFGRRRKKKVKNSYVHGWSPSLR